MSREVAWVAGGMLLSVAAMLAGTRLLTELLPTAEYGRVALAMTLATLVVQGLATPVSLTTMRFFAPMRERGELRYLLHESLRMNAGVVVATVLLVIAGIAATRFTELGGFQPLEIIMLGALSVFLVLTRAALGLEDAAEWRALRAGLQAGHEAVRFLLAIIVVVLASRTAEAVLSGFCVAALLGVLAHGGLLKPRLKALTRAEDRPRQTPRAALSGFMWPLFVSNISLCVVLMSERWVLAWAGTLQDVGGYAALYQIAFLPMTLVSSFLLVVTMPVLYRRIGVASDAGAAHEAWRSNLVLAGVLLSATLGGFVVAFMAHDFICSLLLGPEYRRYSWILPWLLLAGGCFATAQQLLLKHTSAYRTGVLARFWVFLAIMAGATYAAFTTFWGLEGLVSGVVLVNAAMLVLAFALARGGAPAASASRVIHDDA